MAAYEWSELLSLWKREQISQEQAIGHLIQHGQVMQQNILANQQAQRRLERRIVAQVADLLQRIAALEAQLAAKE